MPNCLQVLAQSDEVNYAPWSNVMVAGEPKPAIHCPTKASTHCSASTKNQNCPRTSLIVPYQNELIEDKNPSKKIL